MYPTYLTAMSEGASLEDKHGTFSFLLMSIFLLQCGTDYQPVKERHTVTPTHTQSPHQHTGEQKSPTRVSQHSRGHHSLFSNRLGIVPGALTVSSPATLRWWPLGGWEEVTSVLWLTRAPYSSQRMLTLNSYFFN